MKKWMCWIASVLLLLGVGTAVAGVNGSQLKLVPKGKISKSSTFRIEIAATAAKLTPASGHQYELAMKLTDVKQVTVFSNRPSKVVEHVSVMTLKKLWDLGANSLKNDPPNATLTTSNMPPLFVTIVGNTVRNGQVFYRLKVLQKNSSPLPATTLKSVFLMIDGDRFGRSASCCQPANVYPATCCIRGSTPQCDCK